MIEANHRIIVVDDNQAIHDDLRKILIGDGGVGLHLLSDEDLLFGVEPAVEKTRFHIDSAYQGKDGLRLIQERLTFGEPYALAFVDVRMPPGWDGIETIKRIWEADPNLQIVICTAYSDYSWNDIRVKLGFSDSLLILKKPFDNIEVVQLAHALTSKWLVSQQAQAKLADLDQMVSQRTTELQAANQLLKKEFQDRAKAEEAFRVVFDASPIGIGLLNTDLKFINVNSALAALHGLDRASIIGNDPLGLQWVESHSEFTDLFASIRTTGGIDQQQVKLRCESVGNRTGLLWAREVEIQHSRHVLCFVLDISARVEMEQELRGARVAAEAAAAAKSQFLANMSHEIRTPLNGVLGLSSFLEDKDLPERVQEIGTFIRNSGEMLRRVLDDVLDFSKMESGKLELEEVIFSLEEVFNWSVGLYRNAALEKNLRLTSLVKNDLQDQLIGDPTRLRQVLINFISNAIKFTSCGSIDISARVEALFPGHRTCRLSVSISDTGIGIPADRLHRLFQSFSQIDASTNRRFGGTGLGLAISKRLIQLMGGEVTVSSQEGSGTCFSFSLELSLPEVSATQIFEKEELSVPQRILVVEDNAVNSLVIERMLSRLGHSVDLVSDGESAIVQVRDSDCQLVLMDINMPGLDGLQATRQIRSLRTDRAKIPIIALTASALSDDRQDCLRAGMDDFLSKPISIEALKSAIQKWSTVSAAVLM